jgi:catechol 2,3-dioxygenase-like lactoylglutathione lyase family enzyme
LNIDIFGVLAERSYAAYTVIGGWSTTPDQLQIGFTRLLYPFFCGLLISRMGKLIKVRGGFWWCSLFIVILLGMPWLGLGTEGDSRWTNGLYEAFCILVCFPIIVAIGAGSSVKGGKSEAINKFLGDISYPIYITHYPLIYMQMSWAESHKDAPLGMHIFVAVCIFFLAIGLAYATLKLYDLALFCRDLVAMRQFFLDYFEAVSNEQYHNPRTGLRTYILSFPHGGALLELMQRPDTIVVDPSKPNIGFIHVSFAVGSKEAVDAKTIELHDAGYQVTSGPRTTGDGYYESCILGPEGIQIEITI